MKIVKMHGLGNDFILIDNRQHQIADVAKAALSLCHRRLAVGADGLLLIEHSETADIRMRIINSDGSEAEMCGNGIRCFARYVYDVGLLRQEEFSIETLAGAVRPRLILGRDGQVQGVRVDMGAPSFARADVGMEGEGSALEEDIFACGRTVHVGSILMGVPHTVVMEDILDDNLPFDVLAPAIEHHPAFRNRTNVNFARILDSQTITLRTWERGAGPTMACGTGATGSVCILHARGLIESEADVQLEAGVLHISIEPETVYMTGPAEYAFAGETVD